MSSVPRSDNSSSMREKDVESSIEKRSELEVAAPVPTVGRSAWWKMDLCILPVATMIFFLSFLDRANIGNARVAGLQKQLHMTNDQYSIVLTVTYVPYILVELPSNLLLKRVGPNIMLPAMTVLWGIVTTLQGVVTSYSGLIACRFFLGLFEGGLLPGLALYLASFYPRQKLQLRISLFFVSTSLAGAFSGLLATAIIKMEGVGGRHGWAWIFILEGLFTVVFGVCSFFLLPKNPLNSRFLTSTEKNYVETILRNDGVISQNDKDDEFSWSFFRTTFTKPHVLILAIAGFFNGSTLYGLAYFLPTIVASLGYTANHAQLMSVPPFAASFALSMITSFLSDRYGKRGLNLIFFALTSIVGFAMFLGSDDSHTRYGALFLLLPGTYAAAPPLAAWIANNTAPHVRRATALAFLTTMTNCGGILSTWLLGSLSAPPKYTKASITFLIFQVGILLCAQLNIFYLIMRNKKKAVTRTELGSKDAEPSGAGDDSAWFEYKL